MSFLNSLEKAKSKVQGSRYEKPIVVATDKPAAIKPAAGASAISKTSEEAISVFKDTKLEFGLAEPIQVEVDYKQRLIENFTVYKIVPGGWKKVEWDEYLNLSIKQAAFGAYVIKNNINGSYLAGNDDVYAALGDKRKSWISKLFDQIFKDVAVEVKVNLWGKSLDTGLAILTARNVLGEVTVCK